MVSSETTRTAAIRQFKFESTVTVELKVVAVVGPFTIRKRDGSDLLKLEVILENAERDAFKLSAWGPHLAFLLQRLVIPNALMRLSNLQCLEMKFITYRVGTLPAEFKFQPQTKVELIKDNYVLPELPLSTVAEVLKSNNVRCKTKLQVNQLLPTADGHGLVGNVQIVGPSSGQSNRVYCVFKEVPEDQCSQLKAAGVVTVTCTVRMDQAGLPTLRVECWHDVEMSANSGRLYISGESCHPSSSTSAQSSSSTLDLPKSAAGLASDEFASVEEIKCSAADEDNVLRVKCSLSSPFVPFGNEHGGEIFVSDSSGYLCATLRICNAPVRVEQLPADTELTFTGSVSAEAGDDFMFKVNWADVKVLGEDVVPEEGTQEFPEYEVADVEVIVGSSLCFVVVRLLRRFEQNSDGYFAFGRMHDKKSLSIRIQLIGDNDGQPWPLDLPVNSTLRIGGSVAREGKRFTMHVGSPDDIIVLEAGQDRKSLVTGMPTENETDADAGEREGRTELDNVVAGGVHDILATSVAAAGIDDGTGADVEAVGTDQPPLWLAKSIKQEKLSLEGFSKAIKTKDGAPPPKKPRSTSRKIGSAKE